MAYKSDWNESTPDEAKLGRAEPNWPLNAEDRTADDMPDMGECSDGVGAYSQNDPSQ